MHTFAVDAVKPIPRSHTEQTVAMTVKKLVGREVEASDSNAAGKLIDWPANPFMGAVHTAYNEHLPLILRPDDIWLCVTQGLAAHVNARAEALRGQFVSHAGKAEIVVIRDGFLKGCPHNDWQDVFGEFSAGIEEYIGKKHDLIVADFSTTGPIEKAASEVVLMDAMQSYFVYTVMTRCGFPTITLLGSVEDWKSVRRRAEVLSEYGLGWWTCHLLPVLDKFVEAASGSPDPEFWRRFYKDVSGSGGTYITGWINVLFPYLKSRTARTQENGSMGNWHKTFGSMFQGPTNDAYPSGIAKVPFTWNYLGALLPMEFLGGFLGVSLSSEGVSPAIGWAVCDAVER